MFIPNTDARLLRKAAKRDIHGRETFAPGVPIRCSVVSLSDIVTKSSVRADSTASRGAADEQLLGAKILVGPNVVIVPGDVVEILGRLVEVSSVHPRNDIMGKIDHQEIGGNLKGDI